MKTRTMKAAGILLVLTLITSCFVGGTFAKYITAEDIGDTARVAKWGVQIQTAGTLFAEQYKDLPVADAVDAGENITVQVADAANVEQNVVAPGTENTTGISFVLKGTPEVDVKLDVVVETTEIMLPAGDYEDYTTGNLGDEFNNAADYYPVVFTLANGNGDTLVTGNLAAIEAWLEGLTTARIDANTNLATNFTGTDGATKTDGDYKLTWVWDYGTEGAASGNDAKDTYIGNVLTGTVNDDTVETDMAFSITITATQID